MAKSGPNWEGGCDSALEKDSSGDYDSPGAKAPVHNRDLTYAGTEDGAGGGAGGDAPTAKGDSFGKIDPYKGGLNQP